MLYWTGIASDVLSESNTSGTVSTDYVFFGGKRIARLQLPSAWVDYYFSDHLGSHSVMSNADGSVFEQESDYYPFGRERANFTAGGPPFALSPKLLRVPHPLARAFARQRVGKK
jgi:hypothetical protein